MTVINTYNVASLFAGVGGICLGFKNAKVKDKSYQLVLANELDKNAAITYKHNFKHDLIHMDINEALKTKKSELTKHKVDVLTAGFPCQAFSIAGERQGFKDPRGTLFWSIIKYIKLLEKTVGKPRILFLENVKNLKTHDDGNTYKTIIKSLNDIGYKTKDAVLNTYKYCELPQNRERIYIIGFLNENDYKNFTFFDNLSAYKTYNLTKKEKVANIKKCLLKKVDEKYFYSKERYPQYYNELSKGITKKYEFYQFRRCQYIRKNMSGVCPTLTANMGGGGHNVPLIYVSKGKVRKLTPYETFALQGFFLYKDYSLPSIADSHLYKQAGNAVSVPIVKLIATEILKIL